MLATNVVLDEVQFAPEPFAALRLEIDAQISRAYVVALVEARCPLAENVAVVPISDITGVSART